LVNQNCIMRDKAAETSFRGYLWIKEE
jgi:hypothetical protein